MKRIYLTFDLEEWRIPKHNRVKSRHDAETSFSCEGVLKLLELLRRQNIKSTFFVTGYFAEKEPELVKRILREGHEIASHSYRDVNHDDLKPDQIKDEISKAAKILKRITGKKPLGFRTPQFSINKIVMEAIIKEGYKYDSSIHPSIIPRYKHRNQNVKGIKEIPLSVMPLVRLPISWIWMRNIGLWWTKLGVKANLGMGRDVVLYFHPWEFVELPKIKGVPFYVTRNCGDGFLSRLEELIKSLKSQEFGLMRELK